MKKLMTVLLLLTSFFAHASSLPDFSTVWQDVQRKEYQGALEKLQIVIQENKKPAGYLWDEPHSAQSREDVEAWLHGYLIKFYIAYREGDIEEMEIQSKNIHQLSYLEFNGN